ncbi:HNH endonuclease [Denitromonas halophila]|uniref:HNH endonuclease n=1 Tax=Denitromonas halophila TaxID=1629404 RepID=A0A557QJH9_9RHOO|nr:HNH endonuclease [Denitromonas halophila]TVO53065.1 HNH endonuclease [Denitromonas halophila]
MSYFWVNHKQTGRQERLGGYLWSPFKKANGGKNATYDSMATARPGDTVFSYVGGRIGAVGTVVQAARPAPKPVEFGVAGANWGKEGWLLPVDFEVLERPLKPKDAIESIRPRLPLKHSPIQPNGNGNQACYLAPISDALGTHLLELLGRVLSAPIDDEAQDVREIEASPVLSETEKAQLIQARRGQGRFRSAVLGIEPRCRVTGVDVPELLRASHIKPWRDSDNCERLDGNNGLMLAPHVDVLFDRGLISFSDAGGILVSPQLSPKVLGQWGINPKRTVGIFSPDQSMYLRLHRQRFGYQPE